MLKNIYTNAKVVRKLTIAILTTILMAATFALMPVEATVTPAGLAAGDSFANLGTSTTLLDDDDGGDDVPIDVCNNGLTSLISGGC